MLDLDERHASADATHDLGKNIVNVLLSCHSFVVRDLGVEVRPTVFAEQATQVQPHPVGLSGPLTGSCEATREMVALLRAQRHQGPIIIGVGQLNGEVRRHVDADHSATDAVTAEKLCR